MFARTLGPKVAAALGDTPAVFLGGPRQAGKSTLARTIADARGMAYLSLDDATALAAARADPTGFVESQARPVVLDEVQRVPDLFRAIKSAVDRYRRPGRFLLTGSASVLVLPDLAASLAGRMEPITLWPFSQGELSGHVEGFVDALFGRTLPRLSPASGPGLWSRVLAGGFPEAVQRRDADRRRAWYASYITTVLQREVRDLAHVDDLAAMPRLLALTASRATGLLNVAGLGRDAATPNTTLRRYLALFEGTFLTRTLPAWSRNIGKRLARAPKLMLTDSGLLGHLLGADLDRLDATPTLRGSLLENFAAMEIVKQAGWSRTAPVLMHFRTHAGAEADLVLEDAAGRVVGIEIRSAARVNASDFRGLEALALAVGNSFVRGVILYGGREVVPFGPARHAIPIRALWSW